MIYTKHDKAVPWAKALRKLAFWRSKFLWGEMGKVGYKGNDPRVINHDVSSWSDGHSAVFKSGSINLLKRILREAIY